MLSTLPGIAMLVKPVHPLNARSPILVIEAGIMILVNFVQPENADPPILSPVVITTELNSPFLIADIAEAGIVAVLIGHPENADSPMLTTESGIVTFVSVSQ